MLDNLPARVLSVVGVDRSGDSFTGGASAPRDTSRDTKEPDELQGIALFLHRLTGFSLGLRLLPPSARNTACLLVLGVGGMKGFGWGGWVGGWVRVGGRVLLHGWERVSRS